MTTNSIIPIILFKELLSGITSIYTLKTWGTLKPYRTKYLHILLLVKINSEKYLQRKYSSPTNQNVEEINIARKQSLRRRN